MRPNYGYYAPHMAQGTKQYYSFQGRPPWIEKDLMNMKPNTQFQKFEGNNLVARLDISENGEHFLQDGLHRIPAIFSTSCSDDSSEWSFHQQRNQLENGMAVKVLLYSYNIIRTKDGSFQFLISVDNWEHVTDDLPCFSEQLINVNSLETIKNRLQNCLMNIMGDPHSGSPMLQSQLHSQSQNLYSLINEANETFTSSQSQQQCRSLEMSSQLSQSAHFSQKITSRNISPDSSNCRLTMDICPTKPSVAPVKLACISKEVMPKSAKSCISLVNSWNKSESICQSNQQSHITGLPAHSSEKIYETCIGAVADHSISPTQLLEMMAQETEQNDDCDQEKLNCSGTVGKKDSLGIFSSAVFHELQLPTFEDLFVPSDQRRALAQLEDWCSSSNPSQDSSSSPAFLLSLQNKMSSPESLLLQPTIKEAKKCSKTWPTIASASVHLDQELMKEKFSEKCEQNVSDKFVGSNCDSDILCGGCINTENKQMSNNSLSLFSDTDNEISFSDENLNFGIKPNEGNIKPNEGNIRPNEGNGLQQEKNCLVVSYPESNGNIQIWQKGKFSGSNENNVMEQSCDNKRKNCDNVTNDPSQVSEIDSSQMDTADPLIAEELSMKCEPHKGCGKLEDKYVDRKNAENHGYSTESKRKKCTEIDIISSRDGISDMETDLAPETIAEISNQNTAIMSDFIDLSSTDDIYMIAGHDIDSITENPVSSTDSEILSLFNPCHVSTEIHVPETLGAPCSDHLYEDQKTTDKEVTNDCTINKQECTKSPSCVKLSYRSASSEINLSTSELQNHPSTSRNQDTSETESATSQPRNSIGQAIDPVSYDFPLSGKVSSLLCHTPLCTSQNSSNTNLVLKTAVKNITAAISKDLDVKTNGALTTPESHLHKVPIVSDCAVKDREHYTSPSVNPGKGTSSSPLCNSLNNSLKITPFLPAAKKSPSCAPESPTMQLRVVVSDITKGRYKSVLSEGRVHLSDISDSSGNSPPIKRNKEQLTSHIKDGRIKKKRKQNWNGSFIRESYVQLQKLDLSYMHILKKHYSINVTKVEQHAPNVLEINPKSKQPVSHRLRKKPSYLGYNSDFSMNVTKVEQHAPNVLEIKPISERPVSHRLRKKPSYLGYNSDSTKQLIGIKEKDSVRLEEMQSMHQHHCAGQRRTRATAYRYSESVIPRIERTDTEKSVTDNVRKISVHRHKKKLETSSSSHVLPLLSSTASSSASDCTNVTSLLGTYSEHQIQENHGSLSGQPELPLSPPIHVAAFESQGFVTSAYDDNDMREHSQNSSFEFEPHLTESILSNANDNDSLWTLDKLDQSIASAVNYVCYGKFL